MTARRPASHSSRTTGPRSQRFWLTILALAILLMAAVAAVVLLGRGPPDQGATVVLSEEGRWELVRTYAPVLRFSAQERTLPLAVDAFIEHSRLIDGDGTMLVDHPTVGDLASAGSDTFLDNYQGSGNDLGVIEWYEGNASLLEPTMYAHVIDGQATVVLQYWMFYVYNLGTFNSHEGDWEMVQVVLNGDLDPQRAVLSQHHSFESREWGKATVENVTHPVVVVSRGSHALYFPGSRDLHAGDEALGDGVKWAPGDYAIEPLGEEWGPVPGWLLYPGKWGEEGGMWSGVRGMDGPPGPMFREDGAMWDGLSWG